MKSKNKRENMLKKNKLKITSELTKDDETEPVHLKP